MGEMGQTIGIIAVVFLGILTAFYWINILSADSDTRIADLNSQLGAAKEDTKLCNDKFSMTQAALSASDLNKIACLSGFNDCNSTISLKSAALTSLQSDYNSLNSQYLTLNGNYSTLQTAKAACDSNKNALDFTLSISKQDLNVCRFDLNKNISDKNNFLSDFNVSDFNAAKIKINSMNADNNACLIDKNKMAVNY
jgi:hypothetical protein